MTELLEHQRAALISDLAALADGPADRFRKLDELGKLLAADIKRAKAEAVVELHEGRSWNQVGALLGVTGSRAEQLSRASR
ncbi:hypothetical protein [Streptomyces sp. NPDC126499]|uniref:hypothetical protein n=1 Tax=Streptomyces sp. NPDC126499 TaxID=3155314 RepID=UPI00331A4493